MLPQTLNSGVHVAVERVLQTLAQRSKELHRQKESDGKTRAWKKSVRELEKSLMALEDSEAELTASFPQSTDPDMTWTVTVRLHCYPTITY